MAFMGGLIGLFGHAWYTALDKHFPGTTLKIITKKILLDQLIFSPLYMYPFFIGKLILIDTLYRQWLDINIDPLQSDCLNNYIIYATETALRFPDTRFEIRTLAV